ncbi:MAG TPA: UDP-N-acetylmuramate dehydrogenase [Candidatus Babeliales bacterium]|nr:UDP-N-acetylmuramate dehydrogenase [Candidatus Babeliales bacterium]
MNLQLNQQFIYDSCLIETTVPLADKNWFKTGGSAAYFCEPMSAQEMQDAVRFAHEHDQSITLIGKGANMLISDDGIDGLVLRPQITEISVRDGGEAVAFITAGSGVSLDTLITYCLANNMLGLEEFSGIPGTVGGAVYINLHYFEFLLSQFLVKGTVLDIQTGELLIVDAAWFAFGYNTSTLHNGRHILIDATFRVYKGDCSNDIFYAQGRRDEIIRHRNQRYPSINTCGSFFRNFHPYEVTREVNGRKAIWVAYYLDKIGVKGELRVGDAQVSHQHANMIVNLGSATSADIIGVARAMQELVYAEFGIIPQPECRLMGFDDYPLIGSIPSTSFQSSPRL